jgi:hypothetical protein
MVTVTPSGAYGESLSVNVMNSNNASLLFRRAAFCGVTALVGQARPI